MLHVMHGHRQLEGAVEIVPGVFLGGEAAATDAVRTGALTAATFKFFSGALVWGPGQLQAEVDKGAWCVLLRGVVLVWLWLWLWSL